MVVVALLLAVCLAGASTADGARRFEQAPPGPPEPPPLTLAAALARAKTDSPFRASAKHLADASVRAAALAGRPLNPLLELRTENWGPTRAQLPLDLFATVTQTLEAGGKRSARAAVAAAERELAGSNLVLADRQVAVRTVQVYVAALRARGILESLRLNRDGLATLIASMRRRVAEGYSAESDLLRFEAEAARLDIEVARATVELARDLALLGVVTGSQTPLVAAQLVEPAAMAPPSGDRTLVEAAIGRHPEVQAADARMVRARQLSGLERARGVPDPILTAGYKRTAGFDSAVVGVMMTVPLFDRNGAAVARAAGDLAAASSERALVAQRLTSEASALIEAARTLTARAERAGAELLEPAESVRAAALATFREGTSDVLKLIDAERVYADVRRAATELRLEALLATLEARMALGEETIP